ncbi:MAG: type II toxin-antitoxin system HipA family toxin, partial [Gemmatimonadetes bacterium]|nr:type II toxin-antitoxin system HipA family toxin [Gemmatimonadota bacterium]
MSSSSCYVYIQMPESTEILTAGRFQLDHLPDGSALGRFVYGRRYLDRPDAVPLDPYNLPLEPTEFRTTRLGGVFGALRDVAPDFWGRRVIDRRYPTRDLTEFDYLVHPARGRIGAISFGQEVEPLQPCGAAFPGLHNLQELRNAAARIEADEPVDEAMHDLLEPGSSVGGARPKTVIEDAGATWLAKFPQRRDRWSNAPVGGGMLRLASRCGIRVPEVRVEDVGSEQVLLVKRFDREPTVEGELKYRMVSALTVLGLDDTVTERSGWSYLALADELQRWSEEPILDKQELFRRIVFNALISNTDDHPRNHALIAPGRFWRLSPAYDLTPSTLRSLEHRDLAMAGGDLGRVASRQNFLSAAPRFGFLSSEAGAIIDEMNSLVSGHWSREITSLGGSQADCDAVQGAFVYP